MVGRRSNRERVNDAIRAHPTGRFTAPEIADGVITVKEAGQYIVESGLVDRVGIRRMKSGYEVRSFPEYQRRPAQ